MITPFSRDSGDVNRTPPQVVTTPLLVKLMVYHIHNICNF